MDEKSISLQEAILNECISYYLFTCKEVNSWGWEEKVPEEFIILESLERTNEYNSWKSIKKQWQFYNGKMEPYSIQIKMPTVSQKRFFDSTYCLYYITADEKNAYLDFYFAPLFARAFRYDISNCNGCYHLENRKLIWAS